ncbi:hypothetical protein QRD89_05155 [Halobacillus sp. ACCC02827]|uniref:hypothetical protein n=1 Tax=Bacillaceae TaxID=186817 RepID=UPI0002A4DD79|nr:MULTISPECIES: hypothetical protein [Bacillaceae]ELK47613.1 hypothetical protein D479_05925 [Halobacillus sp. BAB-2008]WJE16736.1 hypothetical protein QRD89_05155 [Halobacillus sp. ACCC02827]
MNKERTVLMICSHPVYWKERKIENNRQVYIEHEAVLELFEDRVQAPDEQFTMDQIHDVSYRGLSETYGFFYLHTIKGVRTFIVKETPLHWIEAFRTCR